MICCGEDRNTPFCPQCGNQLITNDLWSLLRHIRSTIKSRERSIKTEEKQIKHWNGDDDEKEEAIRMVRIQGEKTIEKWKSWECSLIKLLKEDSDVPSPDSRRTRPDGSPSEA
jgi:hypothetical protein